VQVLHLRAVLGGLAEGQLGDVVVGDRNVEAVAEGLQVVRSSFFCWWAMFWPSPALPMP
jgi:hypothetical protein